MSRASWMVSLSMAGILLTGCAGGKGGGGSSNPDVVTFGIEPWEVAAQEDRIWCKTMKVPSDVTLDVSSFSITMPGGSHHFILYRSDADVPDGFGACDGMDRTFVTGSQTAGTTEFSYPDGLALPLFAGEQLILESHYANANDTPITASVQVEARIIPHAEVVDYVQTILVPYTGFSIPPQTTGYTDGMTVPEQAGFNVISMSGHTHKRMKNFIVDRITPAGTTRIYTNTDWHAPPVLRFDPAMVGTTGNQLRFECTWDNETTAPIVFGTTTEDEMCIMVLTFFPAFSYSP